MGGGMVPLLFLWLFVSSASGQIQTVSFSISVNQPGRAFRQFIDEMRAMLRVMDRPFLMEEAGRLPRQEDVPTRFINLELRTADQGITLWMRMDNLYVLGFRNGIGAGTWFEFNGSVLIPGSTPLRFGMQYNGRGIGSINQELPLGRPYVEVAIDTLATHGNGENVRDNDLKAHIRTLIVHFVESMRFLRVAERVARVLSAADEADSEPAGTLGSQLNVLVQNWGLLSGVMYAAVDNVVEDAAVLARRLAVFGRENITIHDASDAARLLGLVLLTNKHLRRVGHSVEDNADHVPAGLRLVQVIDVIVRRIDDEDPGDLYGSITIEDGIGSQQLFYRDRSDTQSVGPGGHVQLTGPDRGISAADPFDVNVDLMDKDSDPSPDDNVSTGLVVWDSLMVTSDHYDVVQSWSIDGASGQVELLLAVMTDAVLATVEVVIIDSSEGTPNVYGNITAITALDDGTPLNIDLMGLTRDQEVDVAKGLAVPLQRKVVAVPLCSTMRVGVFLSDRNLIFADEEIAAGYFTFETPHLTGEDSTEIGGDKGRVKVRVTWSSWFP